jgi:prepilin-type N-terminal cleavage/methylation domain-containing protein
MVQLMPGHRQLVPSSHLGGERGFSLVEVMVVVVILGVVSSIAVAGFNSVLRRERINAVALETAGWFEEVRNQAARRVDEDLNAGGCAITLSPSSSMASGAVLATAESACGARDATLRIPADLGGTISASSTNGNSIIFTPRGLWIASPAVTGPLEIRMVLDGGGPMRCVRISETLGSIDIGSANTSNLGASCTSYNAI